MKASGGGTLVFSVVVSMIFWAALASLANIQIEKWCENPDTKDHLNLILYMIFSLSAIVFFGIRNCLVVMSVIKFGRIVHDKMIKSLLYASIT